MKQVPTNKVQKLPPKLSLSNPDAIPPGMTKAQAKLLFGGGFNGSGSNSNSTLSNTLAKKILGKKLEYKCPPVEPGMIGSPPIGAGFAAFFGGFSAVLRWISAFLVVFRRSLVVFGRLLGLFLAVLGQVLLSCRPNTGN